MLIRTIGVHLTAAQQDVRAHAEFASHIRQRVHVHHSGAHFGEIRLRARGEFAVELLGHGNSQHGIA